MASRILVVRFGALGDLVLLTVLLRSLRNRFPEAAIGVATKGKYSSLLRTHPAVDHILPLPPGGRLTELASLIRNGGYDVILDAHANLRSRALRTMVSGKWTGLEKNRLARFAAIWTSREPDLPHVVDGYMKLGARLGASSDEKPADLYSEPSDTVIARRIATGNYIVLAPGAQHATKRWPSVSWTALADRLHDDGNTVVGLGETDDAGLIPSDKVIRAFGFPLGVGVALCRGARLVVANDSGLMHVATAVNTPVVAIFGPTAPGLGYAPYKSRAEIVSVKLPCRPCSVYGGSVCPAGHHRCMQTLTPDTVYQAVIRLL